VEWLIAETEERTEEVLKRIECPGGASLLLYETRSIVGKLLL